MNRSHMPCGMGRNVEREREEGNGLNPPLSLCRGSDFSPCHIHSVDFPRHRIWYSFSESFRTEPCQASYDITDHSAFLCGLGFKFGKQRYELRTKLRNETAKRRFRDCVSRRRMFRNFEHVWNAFYYMRPVVVAKAMVFGGS